MSDRRLMRYVLLILAALAVPGSRSGAQSGPPANLRCEYLVNPLGLDVRQPRFTWHLNDNRRGARQTAYQVQVADNIDELRRGEADLWDSGRVASDQSVNVVYAGKPLESRRTCFWRVRVWDQNGRPTRWSATGSWEMGLLDRADWKAQWIGHSQSAPAATVAEKSTDVKWVWYPEGDPLHSAPAASRYFRTTVDVPVGKTVANARLYVAVDNSARAWVNGQEVGRANGWPNFTAMDIASRLKPGANVIAIEGHNTDGPAGVAAIVRINCADGSSIRRVTGESGWLASMVNSNSPTDNTNWKPARTIAAIGDAPWGTPAMSGPTNVGGPAQLLRKEFTISRPIRSARVYATALGSYRLHINGKRVGNDILTPDWTDYKKRVTYQAYDVTGLLSQGANAIGVILGDGWYASGLGWNLQRFLHGEPPTRLMLQMHVTYSDGSEEVVVSDGSWRAAPSPILRSEIYAGETYDARKEISGWDMPGVDSSHWSPVSVLSTPNSVLIAAQRAPTIQVTQEIHPGKVTQPRPGVYVFDLGQNMVGWCKLRVQGKSGTTVHMRFVEILNPDGTIYRDNLRAAEAADTYTLRGGDTAEEWEPTFTYHGFRYVEVTGYPGTPDLSTLTGRVFHTNTPVSGRFTCSDPMVNQLAKNIVWGQRGNQHSVPTDCPQRDERLGWMGDAGIFSRTACYNMDMAAFYAKWMRDVVDAQSPAGGFSDVSPRVVDMSDGAPAWGDCGVIVPFEVYRQYGDTAIIDENWEAMEKWVEYIRSANPDMLWLKRRNNDFGDWVPAESTTPKDVIATAMWAYDCQLMAQMARATGRMDAAAKYDKMYAAIKDAFVKKYVDETGKVGNGSQTCQALAIHMGLYPAGMQQKIAKQLVADIERRSGHLSTGFVGTCYLMRALSGSGQNETAYKLLLNTTYPSWGYMISKGATTMWERWNGDKGDPSMNSFNHYAFGAVGEWLYRYVAGIDTSPDAPGYKEIVIRPFIDKRLTHARGEYDSVYGKITSEWTAMPGQPMALTVTIPPNTTAKIHIPAKLSQILENNKPVSESRGVLVGSTTETETILAVPAGTYRFTAESTER